MRSAVKPHARGSPQTQRPRSGRQAPRRRGCARRLGSAGCRGSPEPRAWDRRGLARRPGPAGYRGSPEPRARDRRALAGRPGPAECDWTRSRRAVAASRPGAARAAVAELAAAAPLEARRAPSPAPRRALATATASHLTLRLRSRPQSVEVAPVLPGALTRAVAQPALAVSEPKRPSVAPRPKSASSRCERPPARPSSRASGKRQGVRAAPTPRRALEAPARRWRPRSDRNPTAKAASRGRRCQWPRSACARASAAARAPPRSPRGGAAGLVLRWLAPARGAPAWSRPHRARTRCCQPGYRCRAGTASPMASSPTALPTARPRRAARHRVRPARLALPGVPPIPSVRARVCLRAPASAPRTGAADRGEPSRRARTPARPREPAVRLEPARSALAAGAAGGACWMWTRRSCRLCA
ncbi:MAG: hypothetical protein QOK16_1538 [Solirubrobacteraceae bacterium]|nr:hypothetical protein [Solirubrobacteraceae bacterium]